MLCFTTFLSLLVFASFYFSLPVFFRSFYSHSCLTLWIPKEWYVCWKVGTRRREVGRRKETQYKFPDAGRSDVSSGFKHWANDSRDGSWSSNNRRDQIALNGCFTAMWKANEKMTTLWLFLGSLFPKVEAKAKCCLWRYFIRSWRKKHYIEICGELALEEAMYLYQDRLRNELITRGTVWSTTAAKIKDTTFILRTHVFWNVPLCRWLSD
jgi:hypothetical protein